MPVLERFEAKKPLRSKIYNILSLGYKDRERIREAGKLVRQTIAKGFREIEGKIGYCVEILAKNLRTDQLSELQKISKQCNRIAEEVEHAEYGYEPHLKLVKVEKEQLRDFYNFDMKLLDDITDLDKEAAMLLSIIEGGGQAEIMPKANGIRKKLNDLETRIKKRKDIVLKIVKD